MQVMSKITWRASEEPRRRVSKDGRVLMQRATPLIHLLHEYLQAGYRIPGTVSCTRDSAMSQPNKALLLKELVAWWTGLESVTLNVGSRS